MKDVKEDVMESQPSEDGREPIVIRNGLEELPAELEQRLTVLHRLEGYGRDLGRESYKAEQVKAAEELGISVSSLYRLLCVYREEGVEGLYRRERSDAGVRRVSGEWEDFILQAYRDGNKGNRV